MRPRRVLGLAFLLGTCVLAGSGGGCGGSGDRTPATVRGRVLFRGRPLAGGTVVFTPHPDRGPAAKYAAADLGPDGEYRLAADGSMYITAGWYRVAIAGPPGDGADDFPAALRRPDRSGVEREVVAGKENVIDFEIEIR
jgi:hypothetical protein